jgi:hypothetical protein
VTRRVLLLLVVLTVGSLFTAAGASAGEQYPPSDEGGQEEVAKLKKADGAERDGERGGEGGGELVTTGASSTLPLVATAAGLMVVGAGLAFGVQRRRTQTA